MKDLIIVGESAYAEIAFDLFENGSEYRVVAFSCETAYINRESLFGRPIVPFETLEQHYSPNTHEVFVALTYMQLNYLRKRLYLAAKAKGYRLASYISPEADIRQSVVIGEHCCIFEHNVVQAYCHIGDNVVLWSGNHIGHHTKIGSHCFVSSQVVIAGLCSVGENCFMGVNCTVTDRIDIERDCFIGPNSLITSNCSAGSVYRVESTKPSKASTYRLFKPAIC